MSISNHTLSGLIKKIQDLDDDEFADRVREILDDADDDFAEHFYSGLAKIYMDQQQQLQTKYIRLVSMAHPMGLVPLVNKSEVCHAAMCGTFARALLQAYEDRPEEQRANLQTWVDHCLRDFKAALERTIELHCKQMEIENVLDPNGKLREEILREYGDED